MDTIKDGGLAAIVAAINNDKEPGAVAPAGVVVPEPAAPPAPDVKAEIGKAAVAARSEGASVERMRIAAILNAPEAKGREGLAQHLAFATDIAPAAAIAMLAAAPMAAPPSRLEGKVPAPKVDLGTGGDVDGHSAGLRAAVMRQIEKIGKKPLVPVAQR